MSPSLKRFLKHHKLPKNLHQILKNISSKHKISNQTESCKTADKLELYVSSTELGNRTYNRQRGIVKILTPDYRPRWGGTRSLRPATVVKRQLSSIGDQPFLPSLKWLLKKIGILMLTVRFRKFVIELWFFSAPVQLPDSVNYIQLDSLTFCVASYTVFVS